MLQPVIEGILCPACHSGMNVALRHNLAFLSERPELTAPAFVDCICGTRIHLQLSNFLDGTHFLAIVKTDCERTLSVLSPAAARTGRRGHPG